MRSLKSRIDYITEDRNREAVKTISSKADPDYPSYLFNISNSSQARKAKNHTFTFRSITKDDKRKRTENKPHI